MIVRIDYPEPSVRLDLWGGVSGSFAGLDQFNRIIDQRWLNNTSTTPTDIDRYQYGYDQNSNRLWKANVVGTPIVTGGLDEFYAYDPLNRLTEMQRGVLNDTKTGITGTPAVEQDWTLDSTGNWSGFVTKASGTTDLNQSRTSNTVNEITNITESTGPTWVVPAYDAAGNTTTMPQVADPTQSFTAVYDAWNRMISISDTSGIVATYAYDGRNRRIIKTASSETRHFYFTNSWQDIEERIGTSTSMDEQYVWGLRYVDELVCRDDATPQRLYACHDANFNATSITDTTGNVLERYLFDPYGDRAIMNASWTVISSSAYAWVVGHQGLAHDRETNLIDNRNRILHSSLGTFIQRDPRQTGALDGLASFPYQFSSIGERAIAEGALDLERRVTATLRLAVDGDDNAKANFLHAVRAFDGYLYSNYGLHVFSIPTQVLDPLSTYIYLDDSPVNWVDTLGLAWHRPNPPKHPPTTKPYQTKFGCQDGYGHQDGICSDIARPLNYVGGCACCLNHDQCYLDNECNSTSWLPWCGSLACKACNLGVEACLASVGLLNKLVNHAGFTVTPTQPCGPCLDK